MDERVIKYLQDILMAINEIESFFAENERKFEVYKQNRMLKRAIERNLEIIGEAVNRILKQDADFQIANAKKIIAVRNLVIHAYDSVSDENIWSIIINHIPKLKEEIQGLLSQEK
jgi:uncharacterized protein with HEPN domain